MIWLLPLIITNDLKYLANKPLKIFISGYSDYFLGRNLKYFGDCPFEQNNLGTVGFESDSKISEDGNYFIINIGGKDICELGNKIYSCKHQKPDLWKIVPVSFGYNFKKNNLCLTFNARKVILEECSSKIEQKFDFLEIPAILMCDSTDIEIPPEVLDEIANQEKLAEVLKEKLAPKTFDDYVNKKFKKKDKEKAKKILGNLWNFRWPNWGLNWNIWNLLFFLCP